jgi:hypothetical protein
MNIVLNRDLSLTELLDVLQTKKQKVRLRKAWFGPEFISLSRGNYSFDIKCNDRFISIKVNTPFMFLISFIVIATVLTSFCYGLIFDKLPPRLFYSLVAVISYTPAQMLYQRLKKNQCEIIRDEIVDYLSI